MKHPMYRAFFLLLWAALPFHAGATVVLPALISDHAVLQKSAKTALWGTADPNEKITATLASVTGETTAGADGKWRLELNLSQVGPGPFDLTIAGSNKITVSDVIVGEVWVASGQSNMEFTLAKSIGAPEEIAASANPQLRQFLVAKNAATLPQTECKGTWVVAGPATSGSFTAVGYYFGKKVQQTLQTPVGLIHSSWGGTPVESWTSPEALDTDADLKAGADRTNKQVMDYKPLKAAYVSAFHDWATKYDRADKATPDPSAFAAPGIPMTDWKPVTLPGKFSAAGLPDAGAVWIRKTVTLHGAEVGGTYSLDLVNPTGFETVYYNGKQVVQITPDNYDGIGGRRHYYPTGNVEGENTIAIRIYNPAGNAGIDGNPDSFVYGSTHLKGEWMGKAEYELPALADAARQSYPQPPHAVPLPQLCPSVLYLGMIEPLLPYTIQGVIWYQGENNVNRAYQYRTAFPLMIQDWRKGWGYDFPFYFCQLSNFQAKKPNPDESTWAELRESQTAALSLPNTGQAILMDLGETADIHFRNKKDVGERLASIALAKTYGQKIVFSGPVYDSQKIENDKIRLSFREIGGGLIAKPLAETYVTSSLKNATSPLVRNSPTSELEGFAICGEDQKWVWADAKIDGQTVVVSNSSVPHPIAVRYAWSDSPTANLYNQAGLPAGPFRTDTFPVSTEKTKF